MENELRKYRKIINFLDKKLLEILAKRFEIVKKIAKYKIKNNLPIVDKKREKEHSRNLRILAKKLKLNQNLTPQLYKVILKFSHKIQREIKRN